MKREAALLFELLAIVVEAKAILGHANSAVCDLERLLQPTPSASSAPPVDIDEIPI